MNGALANPIQTIGSDMTFDFNDFDSQRFKAFRFTQRVSNRDSPLE